MTRQILKLSMIIFCCMTIISCASSNKAVENEMQEVIDETSEGMTSEDSMSDDFESDDFASDDADENFNDAVESDDDLLAEVENEESFEEDFQEDFQEDSSESFADDQNAEENYVVEDAANDYQEDMAESKIEEATPAEGQPLMDQPPIQVKVQDIAFQSNNSGGTVVVQTSAETRYQTRLNKESMQFVIEIMNAELPASLKRPLITKEFKGAAFNGINAYQNAGSQTARIVVQLKQPNEPMVQQEGNRLLIFPTQMESSVSNEYAQTEKSVPPADPPQELAASNQVGQPGAVENWSYDVAAARRDKDTLQARTLEDFLTGSTSFYGRRISIETTKEADVRDILNFISDESGVNMIISDEVKGSLQLKLKEVPWDQAFMVVLKTKGLGYLRQGNVLRIATLAELRKEADATKSVIDSSKTLEALRVRVIPVSYANVESLQAHVTPFLTGGRGSSTVDVRTSSIIVKDSEDVLERVTRLIKELDVPPLQVMIEGKIVEATEQFSESFGVNWGMSGDPIDIGGLTGPDGPVQANSSILVNPLGSSSSGVGVLNFSVGRLAGLGDLALQLALEESKDNVKIVSAPRVMAINKETATIEQKGEVISVQKTINLGVETYTPLRYEYKLSLEVTPQVTSEGSVIMDVNMEREFPGAPDKLTGAAPINSRAAKTKILIDHGQTAVIGGIFQNDVTRRETGVPMLKDLPLFGWVFKSEQETKVKTELLIFLTPQIVNK